jgi:hypothetical protein
MKIVSPRVSILKKENVLSVVILPTADNKKLGLLFLWVFAWSVCGIIVLVNYFTLHDANAKLFTLIYLSFWAYFELSITRAFIWKKFGKEKLWIQNGSIHYQRQINNKGKIFEAPLGLVSKLQYLDVSKTSFVDSINQSFWVKGGERLSFQAQAKIIRLGLQLGDEETRTVLNEVNSYIQN